MHTFVVGLIFRERGNFKIERKKERGREKESFVVKTKERKKESRRSVSMGLSVWPQAGFGENFGNGRFHFEKSNMN